MLLVVSIPLRLVNPLNAREHWAEKARRNKLERSAAHWHLRATGKRPPAAPLTVHMVRLAQQRLDLGDNLSACFKAVRDGIADWLGVDDASPLINWTYGQEPAPRGHFSCRIEICKQ